MSFTNLNGDSVVARFKRSMSDPLVADPGTRFDLRWGGDGAPRFIPQPFANHNGGNIMFGPIDHDLYIGYGDGGSGDDPGNRAQDPTQLLDKILRIDVNVPDSDPGGYQIPVDNPFVGSSLGGVRQEIWAFGVRNPWRWSFDDPAHGGTGALVIGDVGQSDWEEVDYEPAGRGGRNYGWRTREGAHDHITSPPPAYTPLTDPIFEYSHASGGIAITGGFVYRGRKLGVANYGRYFFADYGTGQVWSLRLTLDPVTHEATATDLREHTAELQTGSGVLITSFGVDADGELYLVTYAGQVLAIDGTGPKRPPTAVDVEGDNRSDLMVWRASTGTWYWTTSSSAYTDGASRQWGSQAMGDLALSGDLDGDGKADLIIWRASTGVWYWLTSSTGYDVSKAGSKRWGSGALGDVPLVADVDGDGKADLVIWRPSTGTWFWLTSSTAYNTAMAGSKQWGSSAMGDQPLLGDIDGDGKADLIVWRGSMGVWYWLTASTGFSYAAAGSMGWGSAALGDIPLVRDVDGDGRMDLVVWRASNGTWYWLPSLGGLAGPGSGMMQFGSQALGDVPIR